MSNHDDPSHPDHPQHDPNRVHHKGPAPVEYPQVNTAPAPDQEMPGHPAVIEHNPNEHAPAQPGAHPGVATPPGGVPSQHPGTPVQQPVQPGAQADHQHAHAEPAHTGKPAAIPHGPPKR